MNAHCGGCRARAYGMTGDLMAEDPLCTHTPGKFVVSPLLALVSRLRAVGASASLAGASEAGAPKAAARAGRGGEAGVAKPPGLRIEYGP